MKNLRFYSLLVLSMLGLSGLAQAQQVKSSNYGSWSLMCGDKGNCSLSQLIAKDPEAKEVMLGASVSYALSDEYLVLILRMPPSVLATAGVGIKIDDNKAIQLPMSQCNAVACQSVIKMDEQLVDEMQSGKIAKIAYAIEGQQVILPLSLDGFKPAYAALNEKMQ